MTVCQNGVDAVRCENRYSDDQHQRRAGDREAPVGAGRGDAPAAVDRHHQHERHDRHHLQTGAGRRGAVHDLQEQRQERHRAEHREADDAAGRERRAEHRSCRTGAAGRSAPRRVARPSTKIANRTMVAMPRPMIVAEPQAYVHAAPGQHQDQRDDRERRARPRRDSRSCAPRAAILPCSTAPTTTSAMRADRQVDVEHPAPRQRVGEEAADQRPRDARYRERGRRSGRCNDPGRAAARRRR